MTIVETNAELIRDVRSYIADEEIDGDDLIYMLDKLCPKLCDRLEAAEKKIAELEADNEVLGVGIARVVLDRLRVLGPCVPTVALEKVLDSCEGQLVTTMIRQLIAEARR